MASKPHAVVGRRSELLPGIHPRGRDRDQERERPGEGRHRPEVRQRGESPHVHHREPQSQRDVRRRRLELRPDTPGDGVGAPVHRAAVVHGPSFPDGQHDRPVRGPHRAVRPGPEGAEDGVARRQRPEAALDRRRGDVQLPEVPQRAGPGRPALVGARQAAGCEGLVGDLRRPRARRLHRAALRRRQLGRARRAAAPHSELRGGSVRALRGRAEGELHGVERRRRPLDPGGRRVLVQPRSLDPPRARQPRPQAELRVLRRPRPLDPGRLDVQLPRPPRLLAAGRHRHRRGDQGTPGRRHQSRRSSTRRTSPRTRSSAAQRRRELGRRRLARPSPRIPYTARTTSAGATSAATA